MIKAKKHFGQNFLQDKATLDKIIQAIPNDVANVVEIGPGLGDLTFRLLQIYKTTCFEIDCELFQILKAKFANEIQNGQLKLFCKDALEQWQEEGGLSSENYFLVANLPYYIATKMILNAIDDEKCLGLIVMIQKEVALKFSAKSKDKEFSALSILASLQGRCELLFDVDAKLFNPPPKVTSSVIKLQKTKKVFGKDGIFKDAKQYEAFKVFLRAAFASPRKTLLKNLSINFDKEALEEIFEDLDLAQNLRPHELDVDSYLKVFERLKEDNERQKRRESCN
ncbi:16S rRNA (adenine(1518)-N(6)/adenine(1519)-N(6))-dimethyltransferase RsmA [Campylobacter concisus]|uniref:16S rRNA (adenine(1518)-N(6)/adenine(1519)-N(6))- dimethyltransferase RsmA n=1 Tax=Campylobacter concisus TaxID=199 RepID=UPI000CD8A573|nr:16S rRNA (adenine(1518)-N(6)/adenine(1519)-N(6))-dimethyltransferase RsmA [Campylobacter concisus]MBE9818984.1 16S rRNA (adenine(1518)-N(6)/adenine(1519)-N(6))-dimethyltransferase RsmA [Campylobacter concisus]